MLKHNQQGNLFKALAFAYILVFGLLIVSGAETSVQAASCGPCDKDCPPTHSCEFAPGTCSKNCVKRTSDNDYNKCDGNVCREYWCDGCNRADKCSTSLDCGGSDDGGPGGDDGGSGGSCPNWKTIPPNFRGWAYCDLNGNGQRDFPFTYDEVLAMYQQEFGPITGLPPSLDDMFDDFEDEPLDFDLEGYEEPFLHGVTITVRYLDPGEDYIGDFLPRPTLPLGGIYTCTTPGSPTEPTCRVEEFDLGGKYQVSIDLASKSEWQAVNEERWELKAENPVSRCAPDKLTVCTNPSDCKVDKVLRAVTYDLCLSGSPSGKTTRAGFGVGVIPPTPTPTPTTPPETPTPTPTASVTPTPTPIVPTSTPPPPPPTAAPGQITVNIKEPIVGYVYEDKNLDRVCDRKDDPTRAEEDRDADPPIYFPRFDGSANVQVGGRDVAIYNHPNFYKTITEYLVQLSELAGMALRNIVADNSEPYYFTHRLINGVPSEVPPDGGYQQDFCVTQGQPLWFQAENADVHAHNEIREVLPVPETPNPNDDFYFMHGKPSANAQGVITSHAGFSVDPLDRLQKDRTDWSDGAYTGSNADFPSLQDLRDFYKVPLQEGTIQTVQQNGDVKASNYADGVFWIKPDGGSVRLVFDQVEYTGKAVFIVNGDVFVGKDVNEINAAIVFTGTLTTEEYEKDPAQTWEDVSVPRSRIEYPVDGKGSKSLEITGMTISICATDASCAATPFNLQRQYFFLDANKVIKDINDYPGERFVYDPYYLLEFDEIIGTSHYTWQEVTP